MLLFTSNIALNAVIFLAGRLFHCPSFLYLSNFTIIDEINLLCLNYNYMEKQFTVQMRVSSAISRLILFDSKCADIGYANLQIPSDSIFTRIVK